MPIDIYSTYFMDAVIREKGTVFSFLKDRYFTQSNVFKTETVFVDYDDGVGNLLAPFVIPRVGKVPMERAGYETREIAPAYIAPSRPLTIDNLTKRRAGESLFSTMTPEQRERLYLAEDLDFLDKAVARSIEWMCSQVMLKNGCTIQQQGDAAKKTIPFDVKYYDDDNNPGVFTKSDVWAIGTAAKRGTWYNDVCKQAAWLLENGRSAADLVVGSEVGDMILNDPWVLKMLDNRRVEIGEIKPEWRENGVVYVGNLNFSGVMLDIFVYRGSYQEKNEQGKTVTVPYFPKKGAMIAAPNTGILRYGAVTQVEMDHQTHTRFGERIPKHNVNVDSNMKETILTSRPIAAPVMKAPWRACEDVLTA